jgi:SAM-dependent MidA family methyltransferase
MTIQKLKPEAFAALEYAIPEPIASLQAAQRQTLAPFHPQVRLVNDAVALAADPLPGIAFGNEVLDALPFHLIEWRNGHWLERRVDQTPNGELTWTTTEIDTPSLSAALAPLSTGFSEGYTTEVRTCYSSFLEPLVHSLISPTMFWPDYGFARIDYYHPARNRGTLRTFCKHQPGEDPLAHPGDLDITAHVDFTAVATAAASLGGKAIDFRNQGAWLTDIARDWLLEQDGNPDPAALRQFQTLTHPAHLGGSFHVLELSWDAHRSPENADTLQRRLFGQ